MENNSNLVKADALKITSFVINLIWYLGFLYLAYLIYFVIHIYTFSQSPIFKGLNSWYSTVIYDFIKTFSVLWFMYYLRLIIRNVRNKVPFKDYIHSKLKNIGVFLIAISLLHTSLHYLIAGLSYLQFHLEIIFIGIVIIILSQIMKAGYGLQKDLDLTI